MKSKLKFWGIIGSSTLLFTTVLFLQTSEWKAPPEADKLVNPYNGKHQATAEGQRIFDETCWTCHGDQGKGNGQGGTNLNPPPANLTSDKVQSQSDGAIFWKISEGRNGMASYKRQFSEIQRWELVNYVRELGKRQERIVKKD